MKLVSMVDYVLQTDRPNLKDITDWVKIKKYAKFLKQPLKLEMFVPCDDEGNVLENKSCPVNCDQGDFHEDGKCFENGCVQKARGYEKAQEKVLFKTDFNTVRQGMFYEKDFFIQGIGKINTDWQFMRLNNDYVIRIHNIEDLTCSGIELTDNAIKQLK